MKKIIIIILVLLSFSTHAQVSIAHIEKATATFCQTRHSAALSKPEVQYGNFTFIAPDSIVWKYKDNTSLRLPPPILNMLRKTISGDISALKNTFDLSWKGKLLRLTPRKSQLQRIFSYLEITFTNEGVASDVVLMETNLDKTIIQFQNLKYTTK